MTVNGWIQIAIFFALVALCAKPLGIYIANVMDGKRTFLSRVLGPLEQLIYRVCGVDPGREQRWTAYAGSLLAFSLLSGLLLYAIQRLQGVLPFNPQKLGAGSVSPDLAFNTSMSFVTNTNWQSYVPETTFSYLVQMA